MSFVGQMRDLIIIIFLRMSPLMFGQLCLLFERLAAFRALEGLVPGMNSQVVLEVASLVEFSTADPADKQRI
jgi:hypothetical protein